MNIVEILEYISNHLNFIDQKASDLYRKVGLTKTLLQNLCTHPSPYHIPKTRRKILYQVQALIAARRQQLLSGSEEFINEVIMQEQKVKHKRPRAFNLRKSWVAV